MKSKYLTWVAAGLFAIAILPSVGMAKARSTSSNVTLSATAQPKKLSQKTQNHHRKHKKLTASNRKHKHLAHHKSSHRKLIKARAAA